MFEEVRQWNRKNNNNYFEVYLRVSEEERRKRDPKKLYFSKKEMVDSTQLYEEPQNPDLVFDFEKRLSPEEISAIILAKILTI
jgi:adenylylsulfate kinase-like enzyme